MIFSLLKVKISKVIVVVICIFNSSLLCYKHKCHKTTAAYKSKSKNDPVCKKPTPKEFSSLIEIESNCSFFIELIFLKIVPRTDFASESQSVEVTKDESHELHDEGKG